MPKKITRNFNYTDRITIKKPRPKVMLHGKLGEIQSFSISIILNNYTLPSDAKVYVEAYRAKPATYMRFDFGTVSLIAPQNDCLLMDFKGSDAILFRVKVVDCDTKNNIEYGKLLAEADQLHPANTGDDNQNRTPLIHICSDELGERIWELTLGEHIPQLKFNNKLSIPERSRLVNTPEFTSLVHPEIANQIFMALTDNDYELEDTENWRTLWHKYAVEVLGLPVPPDDDNEEEKGEWVSDAVQAFCRNKRVYKYFNHYWIED